MTWAPCPERGRGAERTTDGRFLNFRCRDRRRLVYAVSPAVRLGLFRTTREARRAVETWRRAPSDAERAQLVAKWFDRESRETWERLERTRPRLFPRFGPASVGPAVDGPAGRLDLVAMMLYYIM